MIDSKVIEAANLFRSTLESDGIRIHDLILFGSSSTGSLRPGSDIDLAIISDDFAGKEIFQTGTDDKRCRAEYHQKIPVGSGYHYAHN
jgi:predicted nucleotidyltransferase